MNAVRVLLEETLAILRLAEEMPLSRHIDSPGMAAEIVRRATVRLGDDAALRDWPAVRAALDATLGVPATGAVGFARWLEFTHARLHDAHPRATTIASMRLGGLDDREIAARLGLGPRLVGCIR